MRAGQLGLQKMPVVTTARKNVPSIVVSRRALAAYAASGESWAVIPLERRTSGERESCVAVIGDGRDVLQRAPILRAAVRPSLVTGSCPPAMASPGRGMFP